VIQCRTAAAGRDGWKKLAYNMSQKRNEGLGSVFFCGRCANNDSRRMFGSGSFTISLFTAESEIVNIMFARGTLFAVKI
jgi:hypothetical protein